MFGEKNAIMNSFWNLEILRNDLVEDLYSNS